MPLPSSPALPSVRHRTRLNTGSSSYRKWDSSPLLHHRSSSTPSGGPSSINGLTLAQYRPSFKNRIIVFLASRRRKINIYLSIAAVSFLILFSISAYNVHRLSSGSDTRFERASGPITFRNLTRQWWSASFILAHQPASAPSQGSAENKHSEFKQDASSSVIESARDPSRTVPVVYRSVLQRLDQLRFSTDGNKGYLRAAIPFLSEVESSDQSLQSLRQSVLDVCSETRPTDSSVFSPCHFLLPIRVVEQESKARLHLLEIIQLAKHLNRILVLPNVAKSRLGLCYHWSFEAYYDETVLLNTLQEHGARAVTLDAFRAWLDSGPSPAPRGQLVSLTPKADRRNDDVSKKFTYDDLTASVDNEAIQLHDSRLPGCFGDRYGALLSSAFTPLSIYPSSAIGGKGPKNRLVGEHVEAVLRQEEVRNASTAFLPMSPSASLLPAETHPQPEVLMLDWGLTHPMYRKTFPANIAYSSSLDRLAKKLAPSSPYLVIHWRMESVAPDALPECAHHLVDTLSNLLYNPLLAEGIRKVWFASDFPFPIVNAIYEPSLGSKPDVAMEPTTKSGTFRDFGQKHTEAVKVLVDAFREGAELERWEITDVAAEMIRMEEEDELHDVDPEFLRDPGLLGILDKMVGANAALFVGGAKGCGRTSSFTKQVIDDRQRSGVSAKAELRNVVEYFG